MARSVFPAGGGLKKPVLLWENPEPDTYIGAFSVELDLSKYYGVLISYDTKVYGGSAYGPTTVIPVGKRGYLVSPSPKYPLNGGDTTQYRAATVSESGVSFTNGATWGNTNVVGICIPRKIYGITEDFYNAAQPEARV